jgi:hypothetical protein
MTDVLALPERRRDVWMHIAACIALDLRELAGYAEGARMAFEFALMDDPPREWPEGSFGHQVAAMSPGDDAAPSHNQDVPAAARGDQDPSS